MILKIKLSHPEQDVPLPRHRDALPTEVAAAARARPRAGTNRGKVLMALLAYGPLTSHELAPYLGLDHLQNHLVSPRVSECKAAGWIYDTGIVRDGSAAWGLTEEGTTVARGLE